MVLRDVAQEVRLELPDLVHLHVVQKSVDSGIDRHHLIRHRHRFVLALLEQFHHAHATGQLHLRGFVEFAAEL